MSKILDESLIYEILSLVEEIPEGKVASYGQIAKLIGRERNARLVNVEDRAINLFFAPFKNIYNNYIKLRFFVNNKSRW